MLEIVAIVLLCRKVKQVAAEKNRKAGGYIVLTVLLWFLFEVIGAVIFTIAGVREQAVLMLLSLVCGALGGLVSYLIVKSAASKAPNVISAAPYVAPVAAAPAPAAAPVAETAAPVAAEETASAPVAETAAPAAAEETASAPVAETAAAVEEAAAAVAEETSAE